MISSAATGYEFIAYWLLPETHRQFSVVICLVCETWSIAPESLPFPSRSSKHIPIWKTRHMKRWSLCSGRRCFPRLQRGVAGWSFVCVRSMQLHATNPKAPKGDDHPRYWENQPCNLTMAHMLSRYISIISVLWLVQSHPCHTYPLTTYETFWGNLPIVALSEYHS